MHSIGKGVKSFKDGMEGMEDEIKSSTTTRSCKRT